MVNIKYQSQNFNNTKNHYISCIGFFDLFHKKHDEILKKTIDIANKRNLKSMCLTFNMKPIDFIQNKKRNIWSNSFKADKILSSYNFDSIVIITVDEYMVNADKYLFMDFLKNNLNIKGIVVGEEFVFSKNKTGNVKDMQEYFGINNVEVIKQDRSISTTNIKELLVKGDIKKINSCLAKNLKLQAHKINNNQYKLSINQNKIKDGNYNVIIFNKTYDINIKNDVFDFSHNEESILVEFFC